jgi:hypothetical protein
MKIPRSESLIFFAFIACVALWAISKCTAQRSDLVRRVRNIETDETTEERPVRHDSTAKVPLLQPAVQPTVSAPQPTVPAPIQYNSALKQPGSKPERPTLSPEPTSKSAEQPKKSGTTLYVTIDGLKVREEPGLKGETIEQLKLYAPVTFLQQKTEWKQEISLGLEKVTDHWVKIRTESGKTGWVFGAGVHFYKMKRNGVVPDKKETERVPKKKL